MSLQVFAWRYFPKIFRRPAKLIKNLFNFRFSKARYLSGIEELGALCDNLNAEGFEYVILDLPKTGRVDKLTFLSRNDHFSFNHPIFCKLKLGRRLLRKKFISIEIFHTDGVDGSEIRFERVFGEKIIETRAKTPQGYYVVHDNFRLAVALQDLLFFFHAISPSGNDFKLIPKTSYRNYYREILQQHALIPVVWDQALDVLRELSCVPELDYILFRARQSDRLITFAKSELKKFDLVEVGLSVFCLLSNYDSIVNRTRIVELLQSRGFTNIAIHDLSEEQSHFVMNSFRSGRWSIGRITTGGVVNTLISCINPNPIMPSRTEYSAKFPIDDLKLQSVKSEIRIMLLGSESKSKGTQIIHSSDCFRQAGYYLYSLGLTY